MGHSFHACSCRERVLEWRRCSFNTAGLICCAIVWATNRRNRSPTTIPRIPPRRFLHRSDSTQTNHWQDFRWHLTPRERLSELPQQARTRAESSKGLKCSAVMPVGPGAAPLQEHLRFRRKRSLSNKNSLSGSADERGKDPAEFWAS